MYKRIFLFLNLFTLSFFPLSVFSINCFDIFLSCFRLNKGSDSVPLVSGTSSYTGYYANDKGTFSKEKSLVEEGQHHDLTDIDPVIEEETEVSPEQEKQEPLVEEGQHHDSTDIDPVIEEETEVSTEQEKQEPLVEEGQHHDLTDIDPVIEEETEVSTEQEEQEPLEENSSERAVVVYEPTFWEEDDYITKNPTKTAWVVNHGSLVNLIEDKKVSPNRYIEAVNLSSKQKSYKHILCYIDGTEEERSNGRKYHTLPILIQYLVHMGALLNNPATATLKGGQPEYSKKTCLDELKGKEILKKEFKTSLTRQAFLQNMRRQHLT